MKSETTAYKIGIGYPSKYVSSPNIWHGENKISFNPRINKNELVTPLIGQGTHWVFDNGQYGEKVENVEGNQYYLSYHYDRVYFNYCRYNETWVGAGSQCPLSVVTDANLREFAKLLFDADKASGVIPETYIFQ